MQKLKHLQGIVFDWAGTMIDHGSRAPASVFVEIFSKKGIDITVEQAREPMGMAKREHIAAISSMPEISRQWIDQYGHECTESEIDSMYEQFLPLQKSTLQNHCQLIPGAKEAAEACREMGLKIGSSTGYTRELMAEVSPAAKQQGYEPDFVLCAEDAPRGRPAPFLLFEAAKRMNVYPMSRIVKVDDTLMGIEAGVNAGCWNIGISRSGNMLGLSQSESDALSDQELEKMLPPVEQQMVKAGAHSTIESVQDLLEPLKWLDDLMEQGLTPQSPLPTHR